MVLTFPKSSVIRLKTLTVILLEMPLSSGQTGDYNPGAKKKIQI